MKSCVIDHDLSYGDKMKLEKNKDSILLSKIYIHPKYLILKFFPNYIKTDIFLLYFYNKDSQKLEFKYWHSIWMK